MAEDKIRQLRVLIANEKRERLELLAQVVAGLGHEVIAREIHVKEVGAVTARERPDVALVGLGLQPAGRLRAQGPHRAGEGDRDGPPCNRCRPSVRHAARPLAT